MLVHDLYQKHPHLLLRTGGFFMSLGTSHQEGLIEGEVTRCWGRFVEVLCDGELQMCHPAGRFKVKRRMDKNLLAVGDVVWIRPSEREGEAALIEQVEPRRNEFARAFPRQRNLRQIIAVNLDQILLMLAPNPGYPFGLVDRYRIAASQEDIPLVLVLNKWDLVDGPSRKEALRVAEQFAMKALPMVASTGEGLDDLLAVMSKGFSVLVGQSGVGKTTLLNRLLPGVDRATKEVASTGKGKHTTSLAERFILPGGGTVADTPGIREFQPTGLEPQDLIEGFPELHPDRPCKFGDCLHRQEPGCPILAGVESGELPKERYQSYRKLVDEMLEA